MKIGFTKLGGEECETCTKYEDETHKAGTPEQCLEDTCEICGIRRMHMDGTQTAREEYRWGKWSQVPT